MLDFALVLMSFPQVKQISSSMGRHLSEEVFEVPETYMSEDMISVVEKLNQLVSVGCGISLDDYGTGFSSLMYLSQLPVNELKIDLGFVSQMERNESDYRIVEIRLSWLGHCRLKPFLKVLKLIKPYSL